MMSHTEHSLTSSPASPIAKYKLFSGEPGNEANTACRPPPLVYFCWIVLCVWLAINFSSPSRVANSTLTVRNVGEDDAGQYLCTAYNRAIADGISSSIDVTVECKLVSVVVIYFHA